MPAIHLSSCQPQGLINAMITKRGIPVQVKTDGVEWSVYSFSCSQRSCFWPPLIQTLFIKEMGNTTHQKTINHLMTFRCLIAFTSRRTALQLLKTHSKYDFFQEQSDINTIMCVSFGEGQVSQILPAISVKADMNNITYYIIAGL